jgi:hypothetical protein
MFGIRRREFILSGRPTGSSSEIWMRPAVRREPEEHWGRWLS